MYTITGTFSSFEHARNSDFNFCVSLGKLSNLSVTEHISFSAFSSVISQGAGNFIHTISVEIILIMNRFSVCKHKTEIVKKQNVDFSRTSPNCVVTLTAKTNLLIMLDNIMEDPAYVCQDIYFHTTPGNVQLLDMCTQPHVCICMHTCAPVCV